MLPFPVARGIAPFRRWVRAALPGLCINGMYAGLGPKIGFRPIYVNKI
jgi:hypothetical protein